jgi:hypothetical protein
MKTLFVAVLVVLAFAMSASAQTSILIPIGVEIGDFGEYGYESPYTAARVGLEVDNKNVLFQINSFYSPTQKAGTVDGYSYGGDMRLFGKIGPVIGGAGARGAFATNLSWSKTAISPVALLGFEKTWGRIWVEKVFQVGNDPNEMEGWNARMQFFLSRSVRIEPSFYQSSGVSSNGNRKPFEASGYSLILEWTPKLK